MEQLTAAVQYRIAVGPQAGRHGFAEIYRDGADQLSSEFRGT